MAKYKIGDKVRIREDLKGGERYNDVYCNDEMAKLAGKIVTIDDIDMEGDYRIEEDIDCYWWSEEMFATYFPEDEEATDPMLPIEDEPVIPHMTLRKFLLMTDIKVGGLVITILNSNSDFKISIGYNHIDDEDSMYRKFISAYGDDYRVEYFESRTIDMDGHSYPELFIHVMENEN
jgi:hypothetical protein